MNDAELAWLVFAGLYVLESLHWAEPGECCLVQGPLSWRLDFSRLVFKHPLAWKAFFRFSPSPAPSMGGQALDGALSLQARASAWPRRLGGAFFLLALFLLPAAALWLPHALLLLGLACMALACWWGAAASLFFACRVLRPDDRKWRWLCLGRALVAPGFAMRAADALGMRSLEAFHPLAAASKFLAPEAFKDQARTLLLDLDFMAQVPPRMPASLTGVEAGALEAWLKLEGLDPAQLRQPGPGGEAAGRSYCPRCLSRYLLTQGRCSDCGLELKPFS